MSQIFIKQPHLSISSVSAVTRLARTATHKLLNNIRRGRLIVIEEERAYEFGESANDAEFEAIVHVADPEVYKHVLFFGSIGAGEAYMRGEWHSPDLLAVIRVLVLNMNVIESMDQQRSWFSKLSGRLFSFVKLNSVAGSRRNIAAHYDLSNELFELMLDKNMMYSSAYFPDWEANLEYAATSKLELICKKLQLKPEDHLLEIGSGWGGMAIYAAKKYGCKVTTTTISQRQFDYANAWIRREGLQGKIELLLQDYRQLTGQYDKLLSIEMIEAVGCQYYDQYFKQCSRLLKPSGLMLIQAITIADQRYERAKITTDFIQKYIFPGGCLPSKAIIAQQVAKNTDMQLVDLHDITAHYAQTLKLWRNKFKQNKDAVFRLGFNELFCRMWEFYLCYCEAGFRERVISTEQFLLAKPQAKPRALERF